MKDKRAKGNVKNLQGSVALQGATRAVTRSVLSSYMKSILICHDCHLLISVSIHVFFYLTMLLLVGFMINNTL